MLDDLKIIHERDAHDMLGEAERRWGTEPAVREILRASYSAVVPTKKNAAKQIALDIIGKTPIIYHGPVMAQAAEHWKLCFNLQAKHLAWIVEYPGNIEAELAGWTRQPVHKPFAIIDLPSSIDAPDVTEAFMTASRVLSGLRPSAHVMEFGQWGTPEQEIACSSALGEFVALYVAIASGINPAARPIQEELA